MEFTLPTEKGIPPIFLAIKWFSIRISEIANIMGITPQAVRFVKRGERVRNRARHLIVITEIIADNLKRQMPDVCHTKAELRYFIAGFKYVDRQRACNEKFDEESKEKAIKFINSIKEAEKCLKQ